VLLCMATNVLSRTCLRYCTDISPIFGDISPMWPAKVHAEQQQQRSGVIVRWRQITAIGLRWFVESRNLVSSIRNRCVICGDGTRRQKRKKKSFKGSRGGEPLVERLVVQIAQADKHLQTDIYRHYRQTLQT
jgi:hypothetical protein